MSAVGSKSSAAAIVDLPPERTIDPVEPAPTLTGSQLMVLHAMALPLGGAGLPLMLFVPQLYASQFGVSLTAIGFVFLFSKLANTAVDPLVGAFSDRLSGERRQLWIITGAALLATGVILLYFPAGVATSTYLAAGLLIFYTGFSVVEISFSAWSGELATGYHQRTRVAAYQTALRSIGSLAIVAVPVLFDRWYGGAPQTKLNVIGCFILATILPALLPLLFFDPSRPVKRPPTSAPMWMLVRAMARDRLLLRALASDVAVTAGQSARSGLIAFFCIYYMKAPALVGGLVLTQLAVGCVAAPIWLAIARRLGKVRAGTMAELLQVAINLAILAVFPDGAFLLIGLTIAQGLTQSSGNLMLRAIVADLADLRSREARASQTGLYFSVFTIASKAGLALGVGIALPLVAWLGFAPAHGTAAHGAEAVKYVLALGPAFAHLCAALAILRLGVER